MNEKLINLLDKIYDKREVPQKIKYEGIIYYYVEGDNSKNCYFTRPKGCGGDWLHFDIADLGKEVEILEEEKEIPEKIEYYDDSIAWVIDDIGQLSDVDKVIIDKLNDVIDYLKSKGE